MVKDIIMSKSKITTDKNTQVEGEKMNFDISIVISFFAVIISLSMLILQYHYATLEYEYKLDPKTIEMGKPDISITKDKQYISFNGISVKVAEENNFQNAYLIDLQENVAELTLGDKNYLRMASDEDFIDFKIDRCIDDVNYRCKYILFKGLDDKYTLYLIWSKEKDGETQFWKFDEVTINNLKNGNEFEKEVYNQFLKLNKCYKQM